MNLEYDIIVVGGGHAGCEAGISAAKMGSKTLLITMDMTKFAQMSCNPAMGGVAKGQIVREIDALGGYSGIVSDLSAIQFRMLNKSKGPAMWSPRTQNDRYLFTYHWRLLLEQTENLDLWQGMVNSVIIKNNRAVGVTTNLGLTFKAKAVVLTNGTFLNGLIHIGAKQFGGGRVGEKSVKGLTEQLVENGFESGRMKTGTPARIDGRSLDYSKMEEQKGDENPGKFSFTDTKPLEKQRSCFITYTNTNVHEVLKNGFESSPLFMGTIKGTGPRYCPSVEEKVSRFADKDRHQIFVEPEGWSTVEIYVNGFSSSLDEETQYQAMKLVAGFENVKFYRPGYAIEYDYFPPHQLQYNLETKAVSNLFFAGQINGTTGYEEAAAQGLMAGINAHLKTKDKEPFILKRDEAYIGVLIDDLINKGTNEPYRMFTSRAEFRTLLRQDNADLRLTPLAYAIGMVDKTRMEILNRKIDSIAQITKSLQKESIKPETINPYLESVNSSPISQSNKIYNLIGRPNVELKALIENSDQTKTLVNSNSEFTIEAIEEAEITIKYGGYIEKEKEMAEKMHRLENIPIRGNINYKAIQSLSTEAIEKLTSIQPQTLGQASRISGVSPSDISVLMIYMGR